MKHFHYYPQIEYSGNLATNIMIRGKIRDAILAKSALYYQYTISDDDRPDILASKYYGNSNYVWAIFYANNIFDPFFDWPLNRTNFIKYIVEKYGSVEKAKSVSDNTVQYVLDGAYFIDKESFLDPLYPEKTATAQQNTARKSKLSAYDYEMILNDKKRDIYVLDILYLNQITNELKNLFNE